MKRDYQIKPPLGVLSKKLYDEFILEDIISSGGMSLKYLKEKRLSNLRGAIIRYAEVGLDIDVKWVIEYNDIINDIK
ncbi:MAG: hypothetical protein AABY22_17670 [Nanoarchaeota archaeon]